MRVLLWLAALIGIAWSVYWAVAAQGLETGLDRWMTARRAEGWVADRAALAVGGYPTRFEATFTDLALADPGTGLAWSAPRFGFVADSHRPHAVTVTWPLTQTLATPRERIAVGAERMTGALSFRPGPDLTLLRAAYRFEGLSLASTAGWTGAVRRAELSSDAVEGQADLQRIAFSAEEMRPPSRLLARLDRVGILPAVFNRFAVQATLHFDRPWDRRAVEDRRPQITQVALTSLDAKWGDLELRAAGTLAVDGAGRPEGTLTLRATNWREMLAIARASGRLPDAVADSLEPALDYLAGLSGRPETLDVPLRFARGQSWLGPVPIGPAPDLTLR